MPKHTQLTPAETALVTQVHGVPEALKHLDLPGMIRTEDDAVTIAPGRRHALIIISHEGVLQHIPAFGRQPLMRDADRVNATEPVTEALAKEVEPVIAATLRRAAGKSTPTGAPDEDGRPGPFAYRADPKNMAAQNAAIRRTAARAAEIAGDEHSSPLRANNFRAAIRQLAGQDRVRSLRDLLGRNAHINDLNVVHASGEEAAEAAALDHNTAFLALTCNSLCGQTGPACAIIAAGERLITSIAEHPGTANALKQLDTSTILDCDAHAGPWRLIAAAEASARTGINPEPWVLALTLEERSWAPGPSHTLNADLYRKSQNATPDEQQTLTAQYRLAQAEGRRKIRNKGRPLWPGWRGQTSRGKGQITVSETPGQKTTLERKGGSPCRLVITKRKNGTIGARGSNFSTRTITLPDPETGRGGNLLLRFNENNEDRAHGGRLIAATARIQDAGAHRLIRQITGAAPTIEAHNRAIRERDSLTGLTDKNPGAVAWHMYHGAQAGAAPGQARIIAVTRADTVRAGIPARNWKWLTKTEGPALTALLDATEGDIGRTAAIVNAAAKNRITLDRETAQVAGAMNLTPSRTLWLLDKRARKLKEAVQEWAAGMFLREAARTDPETAAKDLADALDREDEFIRATLATEEKPPSATTTKALKRAGNHWRAGNEMQHLARTLAYLSETEHTAWNSLIEGAEIAQVTAKAITSTQALIGESREMRHCVANYAPDCGEGSARIFRLSNENGDRATAEIRMIGNTWQATEVKAAGNREAARDLAAAAAGTAIMYQKAWNEAGANPHRQWEEAPEPREDPATSQQVQ